MIEFKCSQCGKLLKVDESAAGKNGQCPGCGAILLVPQPDLVTLQVADASGQVTPSSGAFSQSPDFESPEYVAKSAENPKHRLWVIPLVLSAFVASFFWPWLPFLVGLAILSLCAFEFVPSMSGVARRVLHLNAQEKWHNRIRLGAYGVAGLLLIVAARTGSAHQAEKEQVATREAAKRAEQQRLDEEAVRAANDAVRRTNVANARVIALVAEAEDAWKLGQSTRADEKLRVAGNVPHATDFSSAHVLRTRIANEKVETLLEAAKNAATEGDIKASRKSVERALATEHADELGNAKKLDAQIRQGTDPDYVRDVLIDVSAVEFERLSKSGDLPARLVSGYKGLDDHTAKLARGQLEDASAIREQRRLEQLERERVAAEAARKAAEEKEAHERAAAKERKAWEAARARDRAIAEAALAEAAKRERLGIPMGETVHVGHFSFTVWRAEWRNRLPLFEQRPNAMWLFVVLTVRNNDREARVIPQFELIDEQERVYESSSEATLLPNAIGILDNLNPDVSKQGYVVFDVPMDRTYRLKVVGGFWSTETKYLQVSPAPKK